MTKIGDHMNFSTVTVIGAGLAGSEAAWQLACRGVSVRLIEMKPKRFSPAHRQETFAELVCSNSLRADDYEHNAVGLLHEEMRRCGSLIMEAADATKVPAGGALAVDRLRFSDYITQRLTNHPLVEVENEEVLHLPSPNDGLTIVATGPLTSEPLAEDLAGLIGRETLAFYDAIAPVVYTESIDFSKAWYQSRYDKGNSRDYINCPMTKDEYDRFVEALLEADRVAYHDFEEQNFFDGCLPIEVMAARGHETLAFGPMKPVGLTNPHGGEKPYAVVQLRQDNQEDTLRNIVGFQTKMKHGEQARVFKMIPGLENAEFARFGGMHKNTFIKSPILLDAFLRLKKQPNLMFAGQMTGCEGYVESAAVGFLAGCFAASLSKNEEPCLPPRTTAFGAVLAHLSDKKNIEDFQPMNVNFGLFPELPLQTKSNGKPFKLKGSCRKEAYTARALADLESWRDRILNDK
jgi:methylenetetrahydrofolate--tRNA-(uracil-5-)-methyltransferase